MIDLAGGSAALKGPQFPLGARLLLHLLGALECIPQAGPMIDGVNCVKIEPDIDYYRDAGVHLLLEVAVNAFGSLSDPRMVYVLRWIAGQRDGIPEFNPLYTIQKS